MLNQPTYKTVRSRDNAAVHFFTVFMAFFAIMNPMADASLSLGLTQDCSDADRRLIALKSVTTAFILVSVFAIAGREICSIFGITLPAFKIAGRAMIGLMCLVTYLVFITCQRLAQLLDQNGINVISKLMGLILAVIGVQMIIDGVVALVKTG